MSKRVIIIASGETERRSLPHLVAHLEEENITVADIRIPPGNRQLRVNTVVPLVTAAWFEYLYGDTPDKFVILLDIDGKQPEEVLRPFRQSLPYRLSQSIRAPIQLAYAQWHLEAWYFGDAANLRAYLGRNLGRANTLSPDEIQNPKLHLKHLLGSVNYTSAVSEEIATNLEGHTIARHSPSFSTFLGAIRNGPVLLPASGE